MTINLCPKCGESFNTESTALHMCKQWQPSDAFTVCKKCGVLYDPNIIHTCVYTITYSGTSMNINQVADKLDKIISLLKEIEFQLRTKL